jgi:hypothetical protein
VTAAEWIALVGVLIAFLGVVVPVGLSIRKDAREQAQQQAEATRQAVLDAEAPIVADRDYWRTRADQLADELRRVGRAIPAPAYPAPSGSTPAAAAASADPADGGRHSD